MKTLHLASFHGNIGDNAQVNGLKYILREDLSIDLKYYCEEIRSYYHNIQKAAFDEYFIKKVNQFELFLVGGGGFFDMNFDYSITGSTLNWSENFINEIKIPIVFYGLGCNQLSDPNPKCIPKFEKFLETLANKENVLISVRNDGSKEVIEKNFPSNYGEIVYEVPDSAFHYKIKKSTKILLNPIISCNQINIGFCLAGDLINQRYHNSSTSLKSLQKEIIALLKNNMNIHIIFFSHISQDLYYAQKIAKDIPNNLKKTRIHILPCVQGEGNADSIFQIYKQCNLIISNRFHGVVVPLSMGKKCIALRDFASRKISSLVKKLNLTAFKLEVELFFEGFSDLIMVNLKNGNNISRLSDNHKKNMRRQNKLFNKKIESMLVENN